MTLTHERLPQWLSRKYRISELHDMKRTLRSHHLHSVCEEARCPNKPHCFSRSTATFMILGAHCSRGCGFCAVSSGSPEPLDAHEPERVALAAAEMGLAHVVVTSVTRDDLPDGGAGHFAAVIRAVRSRMPESSIEVLTPDFQGDAHALHTVLSAAPDVFNHNLETVPSLYKKVRPLADYKQSLSVLERAAAWHPSLVVKSGLMLGLGETIEEVHAVMADLRGVGCKALTVGQYLRPSRGKLPVERYVHPDVFDELAQRARAMGFHSVAAAPLVRSSMDAGAMFTNPLKEYCADV